jgi:ATP-dependent RNA helicase DeaD
MQITGDLKEYAKHSGNLKILSVYGGASIDGQIKDLKKGVHIVVATPGRLIDLIGRGVMKLSSVNNVILDEADEMLNMGFLDDINQILEEVPDYRRTLLFSATMSSEVNSIARNYMKDPVEITIGTKNSSAENVSHGYYFVHAKDKYKVLKRIADSEPDIYGIVFCRTRNETQEVASKLMNDGYNADSLHGDLSQAQRDTVMQKFRSGNVRILVATDVAARGLDVDNITHVINYSLPDDTEVYTHRSGRTGRAGKKGISVSLVHVKEKQNLQKIERMLKISFKPLHVPKGSEICEKQLINWVNKLHMVPADHIEIEKLMPEIQSKLEKLDRDELLRRIVSLEFDRFLGDYRNGEDIDDLVDTGKGKNRRGERASSDRENFSRLFINLGKTDNLTPELLIDIVNKCTKGKKIPIGKIDLMKSFSFFEVEREAAGMVIKSLNDALFQNRKIVIEHAQERDERPAKNEGSSDWRKRKKQSKWVPEKNRNKKESRRKMYR